MSTGKKGLLSSIIVTGSTEIGGGPVEAKKL
jgi:hypothetical protein